MTSWIWIFIHTCDFTIFSPRSLHVSIENVSNNRRKEQCLQDFSQSISAQFILFLSSQVILEDKSTFSTMVAQDLPVVAPKLATNDYHAKIRRTCYPAAENTLVSFPTSNTLKPFSGTLTNKNYINYRHQVRHYIFILFFQSKKFVIPVLS